MPASDDPPQKLDIEDWFADGTAKAGPPPGVPPTPVVMDEIEILDLPEPTPDVVPPPLPQVEVIPPLEAVIAPAPVVAPPVVEPPVVRPKLKVVEKVAPTTMPVVNDAPRATRRSVSIRPPSPVRDDHLPEKPKPRIMLAMLVVLLMTGAMVCGFSVIVYAIWAGFQLVSKPKRAEVNIVVPVAAQPENAGFVRA